MQNKRPVAFIIPLWKWILLHFVKTYVGYDCEGEIMTICSMKKLFGELYVWSIDTYKNGKLIRASKLSRVNYCDYDLNELMKMTFARTETCK